MKKIATWLASIFLISILFLLFSCQKESLNSLALTDHASASVVAEKRAEPQQHQLKGESYGRWDSVRTMAGFYAFGVCEGHVNLIGKCRTYYNTFSTWSNIFAFTDGAVTAVPGFSNVTDILAKYGYTYSNWDGIGVITIDDQGNSFIGKMQPGTSGLYQMDPGDQLPNLTKPVQLSAAYAIVDGTGKFAGAKGSFELSGYWVPDEAHTTKLVVYDGVITY
jgi:hypothetical protein